MRQWSRRRKPVVLYQPRDEGVRMPLGLLAVGSALPDEHVVLVDGRLELAPEARVAELVADAACLGVTVRTGRPLRDALRVSAAAREANPAVTIVWGGPHATLLPEECLEGGLVDACVRGAGEEAFAACLRAAGEGSGLAGLPGVAVRGRVTPPPLGPPSPDDTPAARYALLDLERYFDVRGDRRLDYCSSRGSCASDAQTWWALAPERVVAEVLELAERYRPLTLLFQDGDFFGAPERALGIARALLEATPRIPWEVAASPDDLRSLPLDALELLRDSGCQRVHVVVTPGAVLVGRGRSVVVEAGEQLRRSGIAGRFVLEVEPPRDGHDTLAPAVSLARTLTRMSSRFQTPLERRRLYPPEEPEDRARPASLEGWAAMEDAPWANRRAESRLARRAFYIAAAQNRPHRGLGRRAVHLLALLRVRVGFFRADLERAAVHASALLRTGRPPRQDSES